MTSQVTGHQPPDETGGAEDHHTQLTVPAHPLIVSKPVPDGCVCHTPLNVPACRNEQFIRSNIYARSGILTHALAALPTVAAAFTIILVGN
jgi:hypothetical protein